MFFVIKDTHEISIRALLFGKIMWIYLSEEVKLVSMPSINPL